MCTAVSFYGNQFYFGRNLDWINRFDESVTITPRNFTLSFCNGKTLLNHYAMIGMATISEGYPLYYDATNELGLSIAGLNFPDNSKYYPYQDNMINVTSYELILWILAQCASVDEAKEALCNISIWDKAFNPEYPPTPLHWMIADNEKSIVVEQTEAGMQIYDNPIGVLTNNPPFPYHLTHLRQYMNLTSEPAVNRFSNGIEIKPFSHGMGSIGLPGDPSSSSRFIRAAFVKENSACGTDNEELSQMFHILKSVEQQKGVAKFPSGEPEYTIYSSCCNANKGIYYYTTYDNSRITAFNMNQENLEGTNLIAYPMLTEPDIATKTC